MKLTQFFTLNLFSIAAAFMPVPALACSPIMVLGIYFENNSSEVSAEQVKRMAEWMAEIRTRYPNHESMDVYGAARRGENSPTMLGAKRARNVSKILIENFELDMEKIYLDTSNVALAMPEKMISHEGAKGVRGANIEFLPGCPHECPCQESGGVGRKNN